MNRPSLFHYATSELSQDAFLCWLIAWAGCIDDEVLHRCGEEFIAMLYCKRHPEADRNSLRVELLESPEKQRDHIDVYFRARILDKVVSFIIEDKTGTSHHSNQLEVYPQTIACDKTVENEIVCVYLKTGYWFPEDYLAENYSEKHPYIPISGEDLLEFLQQYKARTTNAIFQDYFCELKRKLDAIPQFTKECNPVTEFAYVKNDRPNKAAIAQCQFTIELATQLMELESPTASELVKVNHRVRHGSSRGEPWTQFDVFRRPLIEKPDVLEAVFYRVDFRMERGSGNRLPYVCLRQWVPLKGKEAQETTAKLTSKELDRLRLRKLDRLRCYKLAVNDVMKRLPKSSLQFGKVREDRRGANESDIAIIFLESAESIRTVLEELQLFHREFVAVCVDRGLVTSELTPEESRRYKMVELKKAIGTKAHAL